MRNHTIDTINSVDLGPAWLEIIGDREVEEVLLCEFGMGEECIALLRFEDGSFEVGVGECMRPYREVYKDGFSEVDAVMAFYGTVARLASIGCE